MWSYDFPNLDSNNKCFCLVCFKNFDEIPKCRIFPALYTLCFYSIVSIHCFVSKSKKKTEREREKNTKRERENVRKEQREGREKEIEKLKKGAKEENARNTHRERT